ncbi:MAG: hypothetical protein HZA92_19445 [Verrucomicrobia bacterium]|nr:hypothetical protein [Verrucomicrobiota bacterium]
MKQGAAIANWFIPGSWEVPLAWCFWMLYIFGSSVSRQNSNHPAFEVSFMVGFALCLSSWVLKDARRLGIWGCYDFDTFVFSCWSVFVPAYLFRTRGIKAFVTLGLFFLLVISASVVGILVAVPFKDSQ